VPAAGWFVCSMRQNPARSASQRSHKITHSPSFSFPEATHPLHTYGCHTSGRALRFKERFKFNFEYAAARLGGRSSRNASESLF
jgi:hypothetical protein